MALEAPSTNSSTTPDVVSDDRHTTTAPPTRQGVSPMFAGRLGLVIMGAGLLVVGFGWYGISGSGAQINGVTDVRAQLPYLISGGFLGLSLVVIGAIVFLAHTARLDRARTEALLEARFARLSEALGLPSEIPADLEGLVVAGSAAYHAADCHLVDGRAGQDYVTVDAAEAAGLRPCRICRV
jgi:hypothetical protein